MNTDAVVTSPWDDSDQQQVVERQEACGEAAVRRVAAMLDLDPDGMRFGDELPRGWQFILMAADTPRSKLRGDGFSGLGVPMPDLGLPRLMLGGRQVSYRHDIPIGATVTRASKLERLQHKTTANGSRMAVVTLLHELRLPDDAQPSLVETQTYLLLPARQTRLEAPAQAGEPIHARRAAEVVADDTLLFQYSALGFNSHRIHLDRRHACDVEGFPDLVVNGGLATLLLTEFARRELGVRPRSLKVKHIAPLYANRPITLAADGDGDRWSLRAFDDQRRLAVDMEMEA